MGRNSNASVFIELNYQVHLFFSNFKIRIGIMNGKDFQELEERTLVVKNFNPDQTTKELLEELFSNFGPVKNIVLKRDLAYIEFTVKETVGYAL